MIKISWTDCQKDPSPWPTPRHLRRLVIIRDNTMRLHCLFCVLVCGRAKCSYSACGPNYADNYYTVHAMLNASVNQFQCYVNLLRSTRQVTQCLLNVILLFDGKTQSSSKSVYIFIIRSDVASWNTRVSLTFLTVDLFIVFLGSSSYIVMHRLMGFGSSLFGTVCQST